MPVDTLWITTIFTFADIVAQAMTCKKPEAVKLVGVETELNMSLLTTIAPATQVIPLAHFVLAKNAEVRGIGVNAQYPVNPLASTRITYYRA